MSDAGRIQIRRCFEQAMITIRSDALDQLTSYCKDMDHPTRKKYIRNIIEKVATANYNELNLESLKTLISTVTKNKITSNKKQDIQILSALQIPLYQLDPITGCLKAKKREQVFEKGPSLPIRQRIQYINENITDKTVMKNIESLLCESYCKARVLLLMYRGLNEELLGQDLTGIVKIQFDENCKYEPNTIYAPGVCYVADGFYDNGIFNIKNLGLPKLKQSNLKIIPTDILNRADINIAEKTEFIAILSEIYLDLPEVVVALGGLLSGYSSCPPKMIILCGNFSSEYHYMEKNNVMIDNFKILKNIINQAGKVYDSTKFVFVTGPKDPPCESRIPSFFLAEIRKIFADLPNFIFTSNPSKILYKNRVIHLMRDDVVEKMAFNAFHIDKCTNIGEAYSRTIWSQRNICPLTVQKTKMSPNFTDLLDIHHLPDLLVLADFFKYYSWKPPADEDTPFQIVNPGSFSIEPFNFTLYYPEIGKIELSSIH